MESCDIHCDASINIALSSELHIPNTSFLTAQDKRREKWNLQILHRVLVPPYPNPYPEASLQKRNYYPSSFFFFLI